MADAGQSPVALECVRDAAAAQLVGTREWLRVRLSFVGVANDTDALPDALTESIRQLSASSVVLCVLPSSYLETWQDFAQSIRTQGLFVLSVFPSDLNALARSRLSLLDLIEYKLYRQLLLDKLDIEAQFDDVVYDTYERQAGARRTTFLVDLDAAVAALGDAPSNWVDHPRLDSLLRLLRNHRDVLLVGPSSSGKSTLAFLAGRRLQDAGTQVKYADVGALSPDTVARTLRYLMSVPRTDRDTLIIIDDLQSSPSVSRHVLSLSRLLRVAGSGRRPALLAITWPSYREQAATELQGTVVTVAPSEVQRGLLATQRRATPAEVAAMTEIAGDDVLLWRLIVDARRSQSWPISRTALAEGIWARRMRRYRGDPDAARRVALVASLLGRYEFELTEGFLAHQCDVGRPTISALLRARVLRRNANRLTLGHRSLCSLLADWLTTDSDIWRHFRDTGQPAQPVDIVHAYIRSADPAQVWAILRTLRLHVGFRGSDASNRRAAALAEAWNAIDSLLERIERQQSVDSTWGNNLASALFAIEALCAVGKREQARPSIEFMRSHWSTAEAEMTLRNGTAERLDFDEIREHMLEEDASAGRTPMAGWEGGAQVDPARFHEIWASGLVLCAEAAYGELDDAELTRLSQFVEGTQSADGFFYPARVPWCTARVLMGLARCGRSVSNSRAVQRACDWLLRSANEGGPQEAGIWQGGTGSWNTALETTAMCVLALVASGIDRNDTRLIAAFRYITSQKPFWIAPRREMDGANAIGAYLEMAGDWQFVIPEIQYLLRWTRSQAFWDDATKNSKEQLDQSSRVAFITDYLVDAVWSSLRTELPEFLASFALPSLPTRAVPLISSAATVPTSLPSPVTVPASDEGEVSRRSLIAAEPAVAQEARILIDGLETVVLTRFSVVGAYMRYDEPARNALKDARQKIAAGSEHPSRKRENYLIWAAPGSGKTYFVQQTAESLRGVRYREINLAKCGQDEFREQLAELDRGSRPCLSLVDEIDAKPEESWPYEALLAYLDASVDRGAALVFVLAGSSGSSLDDLKRRIAARPKGKDLLSRIPGGNEYEIPPMGTGDRIVVALSQFVGAARAAGHAIRAVEKLALYYVCLNTELGNARQLREFAFRAVDRVPSNDDRLKYDHLFHPGDPENKSFWMEALSVVDELANRFVAVEA